MTIFPLLVIPVELGATEKLSVPLPFTWPVGPEMVMNWLPAVTLADHDTSGVAVMLRLLDSLAEANTCKVDEGELLFTLMILATEGVRLAPLRLSTKSM